MATAPNPACYLLLHEGRRGLSIHRFLSTRPLKEELTVYEDVTDEQRDLLRFLEIVMEYDDHIIIRKQPEGLALWR
jgi:hypothetical protein